MVTRDILAIKRDDSRINVDDLDLKEDYPKLEPVEQTEEIEISGKRWTTQIGTFLNRDQKKKIEQFFKENSVIFAWSTVEMLGIPPSVICHSLNVNPVIRLVKQKKRKLGPKRITTVR